jgi:hypothetical protein
MVLLLVILLIAGWFRFYRLDEIPPGLTHDEADFSHDAIAVYNGARPLYVATYGYQDEPFMHYASAVVMLVTGPNYLSVRATSALFGVLLVLLTFLWSRLAFDSDVALVAAGWLAVSYWPVATSRFALQVEPTASLVVLANLFLWLGLGLCWKIDHGSAPIVRWRNATYWLLFGLNVALSLYAYEASRITWVLYPLFACYLFLVRATVIRRSWWKLILALAAAVLLALPLLTHPAAWNRASQVTRPVTALGQGSVEPLISNLQDVLGAFTFQGDPFVTYNLPGRPIFSPLIGLFFYVGVALCIWRWRKAAYAFVLLWLIAGLMPSILTEIHSFSLRSIVAQPVSYILPALALTELVRWIARRVNQYRLALIIVALGGVIIGGGWITYQAYFTTWARSPETQAAYFSDVFRTIRYLDNDDVGHSAVLSSPFPNLPHDPYLADVMPTRDDLQLRWFDGRRSMVFPRGVIDPEMDISLLVLSRAPLDSLFFDALDGHRLERVFVRAPEPFFDWFTWNPSDTLERIRASYMTSAAGTDAQALLPVDFGHSTRLLDYGLSPATLVAGGTLQLITLWQVVDPEPLGPVAPDYYGYDAAIFVHLLDSTRQVVSQEDRLDFPAWNWQPGDIFVQIHRLETNSELSMGYHDLEIGIYTRPEVQRLAVYVDGAPAGDHVVIEAVEVVAP